MKTLLFASLLFCVGAFASEFSDADPCADAGRRVHKIQKDLSSLTAEIVRSSGGPEEFVSASTASSASFNCEEGPQVSSLYLRRDQLLKELEVAQKERARVCPRSRPE